MSKVLVQRTFAKDTFKVTATTITTGWQPGNFFTLNASGEASLASGDNALFMGTDPTTNLSAPPTGSVLSGIYGSGTKVYINHSTEVATSSATRAYALDVESASVGQSLWVNSLGRLTVTASVASGVPNNPGSASVIAKVIQVPSAANDYTLGVLFRI
jgi:hypothetical protein